MLLVSQFSEKLELELALHKTMGSQISNPYAPDKSSDSTHGVHDIISVESLSAIQEYSKYLSSVLYRCRLIKLD